MRWPMFGSLNSPYLTTLSVTGLVMPLMVKSPVSVPRSGLDALILVLLNVIVGYFSTSRKLDERRSLSRCSLWVRMLAVLMVTSTVERSGSSGRISPLAVTSEKLPRTVIMPRCFAENSTCVWFGSSVQVAIHALLDSFRCQTDPAPGIIPCPSIGHLVQG